MKILAVRGKNLTSLADSFDIDFTVEPLHSAGIFAITGPTGAGKSTLLDAICLTLFDRLPRMDHADTSNVITNNNERIKYNHVAGILRHGAGEAYCEVDFIGQDQCRYRSRWQIKRARGKARGKLQAQKITLSDIASGAILGDKKTDTLQQIETRIGLNFNQFRRAVLLAQGDFDTFIKADAKDRAELLERITGTEIYSTISKAAHEREKQHSNDLKILEQQLGEHTPLDEEKRLALEQQIAALKKTLEESEQQQNKLNKAQDWYQQQQRLVVQIEQAQTELAKAEQVNQAAEPEHKALATAKTALALRAELQAANTAEAKYQAAVASLAKALQTAEQANKQREQAQNASQLAQAANNAAKAAVARLQPELDKAIKLDERIATAQNNVNKDNKAVQQTTQRQQLLQSELSSITTELHKTQTQYEQDQDWLDQHQSSRELINRLADIEQDIHQWHRLKQEINKQQDKIGQLQSKQQSVKLFLQQQQQQIIKTQQEQENQLKQRLAASKTKITAIDKVAVTAQRDIVVQSISTLKRAQTTLSQIDKLNDNYSAIQQEQSQQQQRLEQARTLSKQAQAELPAAQIRLQEARYSLQLSSATTSEAAEQLRLLLVDQQPCPVCGALEHPLTHVDQLLQQRVEADQQRVEELNKRVTHYQTQLAQAEERAKNSHSSLQRIQQRQVTYQNELQLVKESWQVLVEQINADCAALALSIPDLDAKALAKLHEQLQQQQTALSRKLQQITSSEQEIDTCNEQLEAVRTRLKAAETELNNLTAEYQARAGDIKLLQAALNNNEITRDALVKRLEQYLSPVFPAWQQLDSIVADCHKQVDEWRLREQRCGQAKLGITQLLADEKGKQQALQQAIKQRQEAEQQQQQNQTTLQQLINERQQLLEGRTVATVRENCQQQLQTTEQAYQKTEDEKSTAEQSAAAANADLNRAGLELGHSEQDKQAALKLLDDKLISAHLSRQIAAEFILKGEAWLQQEQQRLHALQDTLKTAKISLTERQQMLQQHQQTNLPEQTCEQIRIELNDLQQYRTQQQEEYIKARTALENDNQARQHSAAIAAKLKKQRDKARVWAQLDGLIGSSDGSKFRRFAQSLTLNHLLQLANRQLNQLQPRYELQRAPGTDLVLQVIDHDMADEVRGVHNLSGGERFLISLALALGLADMSTDQGIKVESLFIDEGFGALDSSSLAMAIAVLEQLQATGKLVGVVSHVEELKERIAVKVELTPIGNGCSTVQVVTS